MPRIPNFTNIPKEIKEYFDNLDIVRLLTDAMRVPGVKVKRDVFLKKELSKYYREEIVKEAIRYNPARAGIQKETINILAQNAIDFETRKVTALSAAASVPGGVAAIGSVSADIASYFAHILRVVQKLAYLYGFPDFQLDEESIDEETLSFIVVFLGVMFGVQGATETLNKVAEKFAQNIANKLPQKALTKGLIYPIVKKLLGKIGIKVTKQTFADFIASAVPILGAAFSGGLTYITFKPRCNKLRDNLKKYKLSDPDFYVNIVAESDVEDADFEEIDNDEPDPSSDN